MDKRGQSLVEVALLLPVFFLAIVVGMKVFFLCRNTLLLQSAALDAARQVALGDSTSVNSAGFLIATYQRLSDRTDFPRLNNTQESIQPWRPFRGIQVVKSPGYLVTTQLSCILLPHRFMGWQLPSVPLTYEAAWPSEPPIPQEN